jgi:hypothetical protein
MVPGSQQKDDTMKVKTKVKSGSMNVNQVRGPMN